MKFNIVIIGAGEVGFNLAKALSKEDHSITVIDINSDGGAVIMRKPFKVECASGQHFVLFFFS